jgi:hypothetical protein
MEGTSPELSVPRDPRRSVSPGSAASVRCEAGCVRACSSSLRIVYVYVPLVWLVGQEEDAAPRSPGHRATAGVSAWCGGDGGGFSQTQASTKHAVGWRLLSPSVWVGEQGQGRALRCRLRTPEGEAHLLAHALFTATRHLPDVAFAVFYSMFT